MTTQPVRAVQLKKRSAQWKSNRNCKDSWALFCTFRKWKVFFWAASCFQKEKKKHWVVESSNKTIKKLLGACLHRAWQRMTTITIDWSFETIPFTNTWRMFMIAFVPETTTNAAGGKVQWKFVENECLKSEFLSHLSTRCLLFSCLFVCLFFLSSFCVCVCVCVTEAKWITERLRKNSTYQRLSCKIPGSNCFHYTN